MKYSEFIQMNEGFQYSINLQYDLKNFSKIDGYIPTKNTTEILKDYLYNIYYDNTDKSTTLIGPYGKGKSHLLLILLSIIGDLENENQKNLDQVQAKIKQIDPSCAELIKAVRKKMKFLPVIINSNTTDLTQSFLIGLKEALDQRGLANILPNTYFDSALNIIKMWEASYEESYEILEKELLKKKTTIEKFKKGLNRYNQKYFHIFKEVHPLITSGIEFNPLINADIIKLYVEVNHILCEEYGYSGVFIVFDEFSKFLEASVEYNTARDMKLLQDIAELSNRSKDKQIHLVCVTHKSINEYVKQLSQDKINAWKGIEGRFKSILFTSTSQQNYELIGNTINKDKKKFNEVMSTQEYKKIVEEFQGGYSVFKDSYSYEEYLEKIVENCFPLSPYSTYILPRISEKVAQNERTLFTFLCKEDKHSFGEFISRNFGDLEVFSPEKLYEYFQESFKQEIYNEQIHGIWIKVNSALKHCTKETEKRIIKVLGIVYIVNNFEAIPPMRHNLSKLLNLNKSIVDTAIESLIQKNIIMLRRNSEYIDFIPINGLDINKNINNHIKLNIKNVDVSTAISKILKPGFVLPKKYNEIYKMTRYFKKIYIGVEEFIAYSDANILCDEYQADGIIINLIYSSNTEKMKAEKHFKKLNSKRIVMIVPNKVFEKHDELKRYIAIGQLSLDEEFINRDMLTKDQLEIIKEDTVGGLEKYLNKTYNIEYGNCQVKIIDNYDEIESNRELSQKISSICIEIFKDTPIINNELINKNLISKPIKNARNKIVDAILQNKHIEFEDTARGAERTIFRATIRNKGFLGADSVDEDIKLLSKRINKFVISTEEKERNFQELYDEVIGIEFKIGVRKGTLPIYIAYELKEYLDEAIIFLVGRRKKELILDVETLNNINKEPHKYSLKIEKGTIEKEKYIENIKDMFDEYIDPLGYEKNKYVELIKAIQRYVQSLSKFSRTHRYMIGTNEAVGVSITEFRKQAVSFDINPREFLFVDLLKITKTNTLQECASNLLDIKNYIDNIDVAVKDFLIKQTKGEFAKGYQGGLAQAICLWVGKLTEDQKNYLYNRQTNGFLKLAEDIDHNDYSLINKIAYLTTSLNIEDWDDEHIAQYLAALKDIKSMIKAYEAKIKNTNNNDFIEIAYYDSEGKENKKSFSKMEITPLGATLYNGIDNLLEEFAGAVNDNEKRSVILKLLEKYI